MKGLEFFTIPLKRAFDFKGRATRKEFWLYLLCLIVAVPAVCWLVVGTGTITFCSIFFNDQGSQQGCGWIGVFICIILAWLGLPLLMMSAGARRLHDSDKSGWWQLLCLVPSIGILAVAVLMLLPGTKGENRFGPPPQA